MPNKFIVYLIAFFSGFLSLGQEIIWMRLISFVGMSVPQTFSFTLALFLLGIACGAQIGKNICRKHQNLNTTLIGKVFLCSAAVDIFLLLMLCFIPTLGLSILFLGLCAFCCAMVRGSVFPMVHHLGTAYSKTGAQISNVYFTNVFGSALAPLLISFIALDFLNTQQTYILICCMTMLVAGLCMEKKNLKAAFSVLSLFLLSAFFLPEKLIHQLSQNPTENNIYPSQILESKYGFIQVYSSNHADKSVYGSNVYDGKFNTNLFHNTNGIDRAYLLSTIKPNAKNALIIGLSTGSWAKVLSTMPHLEKITIVEINPDYIDLIKSEPTVADLLKDERVEFIFDDARKWVKTHDKNKYDMILMNTTWHWRAYSSNLLSNNFISMLKMHLNQDGVLFYNSTNSLDAYHTARNVFPFVYKYKNFVLASQQQIDPQYQQIPKQLCQLLDHQSQKEIFTDNTACIKAAEEITKNEFTPYDAIDFTTLNRKPEIITDDNMITEFKYGKGL